MAEDETQKAVEEILDADVDAVEDPAIVVDSLPESQKAEAEEYAREFLLRVIRLRGVKIDREHFLRAELHKRGFGEATIARAIAGNPAAAGIEPGVLDRVAAEVVEFETRKSSAMSFAAGLPGGFAMLGTIPADITQFYVHAFRIMQKVAYVYGWTNFLEDTEEIDDETLGKLAAFLGVMMGVGGASSAVTSFAGNVARPAIQKQIAGVALTKTAWYTPMKQVLRVVGIKLTKDSFAKTVTKVVPVAGGVLSGGLTYTALRVQSGRLIKHLRELPPPHVDAEDYLRLLHAADEDRDSPSKAQHAADAVKGAGSAAKGAAVSMAGRIGGMMPRRAKKAPTDNRDA
ncbi:hypothetical protein JOD52_001127 [Brachybacterium muris]|uniref:hypothetical protein n=1 Tax=Brachybacterium muris TaxID=219301 RepID=UPI00195A4BAE|nr:hypothetical protein [Brachybacterium muris]MBM7500287.1 hypothetical protein [Brachybacterium muris]